ncbi:MAG: DDE-type integrase/transposase/recombinase [Pseudomonadota bacterium]
MTNLSAQGGRPWSCLAGRDPGLTGEPARAVPPYTVMPAARALPLAVSGGDLASASAGGLSDAAGAGRDLYSLKDLSALLGVSRQALDRAAAAGRWPYTTAPTASGQTAKLYRRANLPAQVQQKLAAAERLRAAGASIARIEGESREAAQVAARQRLEAEVDRARRAQIERIRDGKQRFNALGERDPKRLRAQARQWVIYQCDLYLARHGGFRDQARTAISAQLGTPRAMDMPDDVAAYLPRGANGQIRVSERTIEGWEARLREAGIWGLVDGYGNRKGRNRITADPELESTVLAAMVKHPHIGARWLREYLRAGPLGIDIPERTLNRYMAAFKTENASLWAQLTHPDQWKNVYLPAPGSQTEAATHLNALWELDSTPGDWMLKDGRHTVVGCIDVYSRRLKLFVSKTSTAAAVKQVLRRAILDWGLPDRIRTDNGSDYVSTDVATLLRDLEIRHEVCLPFASEQKGTIERAFRTMSHGILEQLAGFIGHNVAERERIRARKSFAQRVMTRGDVVEAELTAEQLQQVLDQWADALYAHNPHGGLAGQTPWQVANAWTAPVRRIREVHALDGLLAPVAGTRTVGKKGIKFACRHYFDREGALFDLIGEEVWLRHDEQDIGRLAVYHDRAFICWAEDPDVMGIDRKEAAAAIKSRQLRLMAEQRAEFRERTKHLQINIAETVLQHRAEQVANLASLPQRAEYVSTPALDQAARAVAGRRELDIPGQDLRRDNASAQLRLAAHQALSASAPPEETARDRYERWLALDARISRDEPVTEAERRWHASYREDPQWRAQKRMDEAFFRPATAG